MDLDVRASSNHNANVSTHCSSHNVNLNARSIYAYVCTSSIS